MSKKWPWASTDLMLELLVQGKAGIQVFFEPCVYVEGAGDSARALCTCNHMCSVVHEVELIFKCVSRQRFLFACGVENSTIFDLVSPSKLYH